MPKLAKPKTNLQLDGLKAGNSLALGNGLHLIATLSGPKKWFVRYRRADGRRGKVWVGVYPDLGLAAARRKAEEVHQAARMGGEIIGMRQLAKLLNQTASAEQLRLQREQAEAVRYSFKTLSEQWLMHKKPGWDIGTFRRAEAAIVGDLQPRIGMLDVRTLKSNEVRLALLEINERTPSTARKCRQYVYGVIDFCVLQNIRDSAISLKGIFPKNRNERHQYAIVDASKIGKLWLAIQHYSGSLAVRSALQLCAWTAMRPGVVASAAWSEIDGDVWSLPASRMKTNRDHIVSLPRQALAMLRDMRSDSAYVFPAVARQGAPHISRDSLSKALRDMGFRGEHVTHGWRASLRTIARERLHVDADLLETQLAHARGDRTEQAYDRAKFIDERRVVMQRWADFLDEQADAELNSTAA